jgi:hypothetical protein
LARVPKEKKFLAYRGTLIGAKFVATIDAFYNLQQPTSQCKISSCTTLEGVMKTATESNGEAPAAKKRKRKDLPEELTRLTEKNFCKALKFRLETDATEFGGEVEVAFEVALDDNDGGPTMELDKLTADQL